eukprot:Stramenopile-MAST_4_protein_5405
MAIVAPTFTVKTIVGTTTALGASNAITITFDSTKALANGDQVTIRGLTIADDDDNATFTLTGGADQSKFTAGWTKSGGILVLTASQSVPEGTTVVEVTFENKNTAVGSITPTIAATIAGSTTGIASVDMVPTTMAVGSTFTASSIVGTSQVEGATNTITITLTCDAAIANGDVITIRGLTNIATDSSAGLPLSGTHHALFSVSQKSSFADWTRSGGVLTLTANQAITNGLSFSVKIVVQNKDSVRPSVAPTVEASLNAGHVGKVSFGTVTSMSVIEPKFRSKSISGSTKALGALNLMTIIFDATANLNVGDTVTIRGLSTALDGTNPAISLTGADSSKFTANGQASTASWTKAGGVLLLTANQVISGSTTVQISLTNKGVQGSPATPTIEAVVAGTSGIAIEDMDTSYLVVGSTFTSSSIHGLNELEGGNNTLTISLVCDSAITPGDVITISGMMNVANGNDAAFDLSGIDFAKFTAGWTENGGILVLTANTGINANTTISVIINFTNKALAQATAA